MLADSTDSRMGVAAAGSQSSSTAALPPDAQAEDPAAGDRRAEAALQIREHEYSTYQEYLERT
jgi:hypothetical protein